MFQVKKWVREFFAVSHAQANGLVILLPLMAVVILSEPAWRWYTRRLPVDYSKDQATLDSLVALWRENEAVDQQQSLTAAAHKPFHFDPNTATEEQFTSMGISPASAVRMIRYREKGGKFRVKADLLKIYGMDTALYRQLLPWIRLPDKWPKKEKPKFANKAFERRPTPEPLKAFDVNLADTAQLSKIRGIGAKLSQRIIRYREGLGGYVQMKQLKEVYGLDSTVVENLEKFAFVAEDFEPKRLNINAADARMLADHPYLSDKEARAIVAYRFQHGNFGSLDELRAIQVLTGETLSRILHYLTTD